MNVMTYYINNNTNSTVSTKPLDLSVWRGGMGRTNENNISDISPSSVAPFPARREPADVLGTTFQQCFETKRSYSWQVDLFCTKPLGG